MSLMKTLAKVALGVAVAKGVSSMAKRGPVGGSPQSGGAGGGLLGSLGGMLGGGGSAQRTGGYGGAPGGMAGGGGLGGSMGGMLGQVLSGRGGGGGLGGMLESLGGAANRGGIGQATSNQGIGTRGPNGGSGLDTLLGGLLGGAGGGLAGGRLGELAQRAPAEPERPNAPFGEVLNSAFDEEREEIPPTPGQEAAAGLMLRAMIQAAKSDGKIDAGEREKLMGAIDGMSPEERAFLQDEFEAPVDPKGLASQVPNGLEKQVYAMSVMAIDLDSRAEAQYLHTLAEAMGVSRDEVNEIHAQIGVPSIYG